MKLVLENGKTFYGDPIGDITKINEVSEIIFTTSMTGYQEVLTDPSYFKQMVVLTYPIIGNYGINEDDFQSEKSYVSAVIINNYNENYSHYQAMQTLDTYLKKQGVIGLINVDTRELTNIIREKGTLRAIICNDLANPSSELLTNWQYNSHVQDLKQNKIEYFPGKGKKVVIINCGVKQNMIKLLQAKGYNLIIVPFDTNAKAILDLNPDGVFISNGPGNPQALKQTIQTVQQLIGIVPIFGICLGLQLLALASGLAIKKLKFGHHSSNHPVKDLINDKINITTQNHNYAIDETTINLTDNLTITHKSLNDQTIEGIENKDKAFFAVQFHPEGGQGPQVLSLFEKFEQIMEENYAKKSTT